MTVKRVRLTRDLDATTLRRGMIFNVLDEGKIEYTIEYIHGWNFDGVKKGWYVHKEYFEVLYDDPCGECKNRCRSDKPCEFYQEEN